MRYYRIYYCKSCNKIAFDVVGKLQFATKTECVDCDNEYSKPEIIQIVPETDFCMAIVKRERKNMDLKIMKEKKKYKIKTLTNPFVR